MLETHATLVGVHVCNKSLPPYVHVQFACTIYAPLITNTIVIYQFEFHVVFLQSLIVDIPQFFSRPCAVYWTSCHVLAGTAVVGRGEGTPWRRMRHQAARSAS